MLNRYSQNCKELWIYDGENCPDADTVEKIAFTQEGIMKKIYLAAPYSDPDIAVRRFRVDMVNRKAAKLMEAGHLVFSPLSHSHPISKYCKVDPCNHDFWLRQDLWILEHCDELHILRLPGWESSRGIRLESKYALELGIPIFHKRVLAC